jgi:TPP-dependent pyruvate/acetoin dehydrogenase alpha subunit
MSTATQQPEAKGASGPQLSKEQLLHIYHRMYSIRQFEEHANDLYLRALMPGLTHLYSGCGGGYLFVATEREVPGSFRVRVRL